MKYIPHNHRNDLGFTLVEVLLYMGLFSIFLVSLSWIFHAMLDVQLASYSTSAVETDGRFLLSRFHYDVPRATSLVTPASIGESATSLQLVIQGEQYTYTVNGNVLQLTNSTGIYTLHSPDTIVTSFVVKRMGNVNGKNAVIIIFTLSGGNTDNANVETRTYRIVEGLR